MRFLLLCLTLLLAACASTPPALPGTTDAFRSEGFQSPPPGASLTLLPPQETQYEELRAGAELLHKQLQKRLTAAGWKVVTLKRDDYLRQWKQEAAAVGGVVQPDSGEFKDREYVQALATLIRKSCEETQCALLIDARLVIRTAEITGNEVRWDGQRRLHGEALPKGVAAPAQTYAISIELSGIQPDGTLGFRHYGGAVLPPQYGMAELQHRKPAPMRWNDADIAAGLDIALRPLLESRGAGKNKPRD